MKAMAKWFGWGVALGALAVGMVSAQTKGGSLTVAQQADVVGLDPHTVSAYSSAVVDEQIYDSLLAITPKGDVTASIAQKWAVSKDGLKYTFNLRKNVKFSDGKPLTAKDVIYSLMRITDPKTASPRQNDLGKVKSITAPDAYTVTIALEETFAPFLTKIGGTLMGIMPEGYAEKNDPNKAPLGSGPFMYVSWTPDDNVTLKRNPYYWEAGKPYLETLIFKPLKDDTARITNVETGNVDLIMSVPQNEVDRLETSTTVKLSGGPGTWYDYLGLNQSKAPFNNIKVRQALSYAVNRDQIVKTAIFGKGTVINCGPIPPKSWAFASCKDQITNLEKAKKLLAEAGLSGGFKMTIKVGADYKSQVNIAQVIQAQLKPLKIDVTVAPMEWGAFLDDVVTKGNFDGVILGWIGAVDPDDFLYYQFRTGEKFNFYKFSDKEVDSLLDQARTSVDRGTRQVLYRKVQRLLAQKAAYVFLHINEQYEAFGPQVQGYVHYATGSMESLKDVWLKN